MIHVQPVGHHSQSLRTELHGSSCESSSVMYQTCKASWILTRPKTRTYVTSYWELSLCFSQRLNAVNFLGNFFVLLTLWASICHTNNTLHAIIKLRRMHKMQSVFTDDCSVCCCLGWTLLGAHGTLCYTWVLNPTDRERGPTFKVWNPPHISGTAEILRAYRGVGAVTKIYKSRP